MLLINWNCRLSAVELPKDNRYPGDKTSLQTQKRGIQTSPDGNEPTVNKWYV